MRRVESCIGGASIYSTDRCPSQFPEQPLHLGPSDTIIGTSRVLLLELNIFHLVNLIRRLFIRMGTVSVRAFGQHRAKQDDLINSINYSLDLPFQRLDCFLNNILTKTQHFDPCLPYYFKRTDLSNTWIRAGSGTKLTHTKSSPAAFSVFFCVGIAARTSREYGGFACIESGFGHEEDELEPR